MTERKTEWKNKWKKKWKNKSKNEWMNEKKMGLSELWNVNYELQGYKNLKQTRDSEYLHGDLRTVNFHTLIKW